MYLTVQHHAEMGRLRTATTDDGGKLWFMLCMCASAALCADRRPPCCCAQVEQEDIDNPSIMDYIKLKHEVTEMEKHCSDWKRKIVILSMEQKRTRQVLKSLGVSGRELAGGLSFKSTKSTGSPSVA